MQHATHLTRLLQSTAALGFLAIAGWLTTTTSTGCGTFCEGGFIRQQAGKDDVCEGKCDPAKCGSADQYACADNHCVLQCTSHQDCIAFQQACAPQKDDDGKSVNTCQASDKAAIGVKC